MEQNNPVTYLGGSIKLQSPSLRGAGSLRKVGEAGRGAFYDTTSKSQIIIIMSGCLWQFC